MSDLKGPNFFIVGAPKCGTTSMTNYLGQHPEIGMAALKESHYFATDLEQRAVIKRGQRRQSATEYLQMFEAVQDMPRRGEASGWYLYSADAARRIHDYCPTAAIIAMIRSPLEMIPSLHSQLVYLDIEPVEDLQQALALDAEREHSQVPPGFVPRSYRSAVRFAEQLRRYLEVFGDEQVHVIVFDDLRDDAWTTYRRTCEFLNVDSSFVPEIDVVNPNKAVRSRMARRISRRPPESLRRLLHPISSQRVRRGVGMALKRWNTRFVPRDPVPDPVSEALGPLVVEQVRELNDLMGLDVSSWLERVQTSSSPSTDPG